MKTANCNIFCATAQLKSPGKSKGVILENCRVVWGAGEVGSGRKKQVDWQIQNVQKFTSNSELTARGEFHYIFRPIYVINNSLF